MTQTPKAYQLTTAARESLIAAYAEKARREIAYGSSEFAGYFAREAARYAIARACNCATCAILQRRAEARTASRIDAANALTNALTTR
jgi:hypothetical protein